MQICDILIEWFLFKCLIHSKCDNCLFAFSTLWFSMLLRIKILSTIKNYSCITSETQSTHKAITNGYIWRNQFENYHKSKQSTFPLIWFLKDHCSPTETPYGYGVFNLKTMKNSSGKIRQLYAYVGTESTLYD